MSSGLYVRSLGAGLFACAVVAICFSESEEEDSLGGAHMPYIMSPEISDTSGGTGGGGGSSGSGAGST